jgi:hypothetical protein
MGGSLGLEEVVVGPVMVELKPDEEVEVRSGPVLLLLSGLEG